MRKKKQAQYKRRRMDWIVDGKLERWWWNAVVVRFMESQDLGVNVESLSNMHFGQFLTNFHLQKCFRDTSECHLKNKVGMRTNRTPSATVWTRGKVVILVLVSRSLLVLLRCCLLQATTSQQKGRRSKGVYGAHAYPIFLAPVLSFG